MGKTQKKYITFYFNNSVTNSLRVQVLIIIFFLNEIQNLISLINLFFPGSTSY